MSCVGIELLKDSLASSNYRQLQQSDSNQSIPREVFSPAPSSQPFSSSHCEQSLVNPLVPGGPWSLHRPGWLGPNSFVKCLKFPAEALQHKSGVQCQTILNKAGLDKWWLDQRFLRSQVQVQINDWSIFTSGLGPLIHAVLNVHKGRSDLCELLFSSESQEGRKSIRSNLF